MVLILSIGPFRFWIAIGPAHCRHAQLRHTVRFLGQRWEEFPGVATLQLLDSDLDLPHRGVQSLQLLKDQFVPSEALITGLVIYM